MNYSHYFRRCTFVNDEFFLLKKLALLFLKRIPRNERGCHYDSVLSFVSSDDILSLIEYHLDPKLAISWLEFRWCAQAIALFQKNVSSALQEKIGSLSAEERRAKTVLKFLSCNDKCRDVNNELKAIKQQLLSNERLEAILYLTSRKIASVVGPGLSLADLRFNYSSGAAVGVKGGYTSSLYKFNGKFVANEELCCVFRYLGRKGLFPRWLQDVEYTPCGISKLFTVPKNCTSDRTCAKEPKDNVIVQKALGNFLRARMSKVLDLNLSKNQAYHQELACEGSVSGDLVTIDLSSASDSISYELVNWVFPDWLVHLLELCRTRSTSIENNGKDYFVNLEMFSMMGNGYTFELESLLFYSICSAAIYDFDGNTNPRLVVYGDDIITEKRYNSVVIEALTLCGFTINVKKTNVDGPFRESCGGDYFLGHAVRPFYIKDSLTPARIVALLNFYYGSYIYGILYCFFSPYLPAMFKNFGPADRGDGHIHCNQWKDYQDIKEPRIASNDVDSLCSGHEIDFYETIIALPLTPSPIQSFDYERALLSVGLSNLMQTKMHCLEDDLFPENHVRDPYIIRNLKTKKAKLMRISRPGVHNKLSPVIELYAVMRKVLPEVAPHIHDMMSP